MEPRLLFERSRGTPAPGNPGSKQVIPAREALTVTGAFLPRLSPQCQRHAPPQPSATPWEPPRNMHPMSQSRERTPLDPAPPLPPCPAKPPRRRGSPRWGSARNRQGREPPTPGLHPGLRRTVPLAPRRPPPVQRPCTPAPAPQAPSTRRAISSGGSFISASRPS